MRIGVEDRGPGVASGDLVQIFDPFYRGEGVRNSQIPGVGLGLSLVKGTVERYHGDVHVSQTPGGGAQFTVRFPARAEPA